MKFTIAAAIAGLAATVAAGSNDTYVTEVLTAYTTYCPEATQITHNGKTYTITEATTLTITDCPCTITKPVYSSVVTSCSTCTPSAPAYSASAYTAPVYSTANATAPVPAYSPLSSGTGAYTPSATTSPIAPAYTGAANTVSFGVAGVLAAVGLVAAL